jgi:mono/diheme cytochrome c family protein
MKKLFVIALSLFVLCALSAAPAAAEDAKKEEAKKPVIPAGQKVFADARCTMCHTVFSAGIGEMPATDEEKEAALDGPPDLSMTGKGRTAEWMTLFLKKEETLNDKKHGMKFMGSDEDLSKLVEWLLTLKPAEEQVEKKVEEKAEKKVEKVEKKAAETAGKMDKAEKDAGGMAAKAVDDDEDGDDGDDDGDDDDDDGDDDDEDEKGE